MVYTNNPHLEGGDRVPSNTFIVNVPKMLTKFCYAAVSPGAGVILKATTDQVIEGASGTSTVCVGVALDNNGLDSNGVPYSFDTDIPANSMVRIACTEGDLVVAKAGTAGVTTGLPVKLHTADGSFVVATPGTDAGKIAGFARTTATDTNKFLLEIKFM